MADPVFGRDVSFYLFELPFLRLVQAVVGGLLIGGLLVAGGRYLLGRRARRRLPDARSGSTSAVLGGLYLLTVAAGYQLDKLELVYSSPRRRRPASATPTRRPASSPSTP